MGGLAGQKPPPFPYKQGGRMASKTQLDWLKSMAPAAQMTQRKWGVPASITLAQCITESGWGSSQLARRARNFFGVKAMQGQNYMQFPTHEVVKGRTIEELADFAVYPTAIESFDAHGKLLATLPRYKGAMSCAHDPQTFAGALHVCGYSTNPNYGSELMDAVRDYNLTQYDTPPLDDPAKAEERIAA
jgi:flagellum-specific peptidoglycan hydrolase FlgJ